MYIIGFLRSYVMISFRVLQRLYIRVRNLFFIIQFRWSLASPGPSDTKQFIHFFSVSYISVVFRLQSFPWRKSFKIILSNIVVSSIRRCVLEHWTHMPDKFSKKLWNSEYINKDMERKEKKFACHQAMSILF